MQIHHPMLGVVNATLQGVAAGPANGATIHTQLAGMFGGSAQLVVTADEAERLAHELLRAVGKAPAARAG